MANGQDIVNSYQKRGYLPLSADNQGGLGFKKSMDKDCSLLPEPVWFHVHNKGANGATIPLYMSDGVTPRTMMAKDRAEYAENIEKGWKIVEPTPQEELTKKPLPPAHEPLPVNDLRALLDKSATKIKKDLNDISPIGLKFLRSCEEAGKNRKVVIKLIDGFLNE